MNRFDAMIAKWNFKRIAIAFLVVILVAMLGVVAAVGVVFREKIVFAWRYARVGETVERSDAAALKAQVDKLAAASPDVVDILILDDKNGVTYSAKGSEFANGSLSLTRTGRDDDYLVSDAYPNAVFRFVKGDEYLLASVFQHDFGRIRDEYDEHFFEQDFTEKTVYMLGFIGDRQTGDKVYIITTPASVAGGETTLHLVAAAAALLVALYWVLLALWAYRSAMRAKLYPLFWGLIVLATNLVGVAVYLLYKRGNAVCGSCGASQSRSHLYCVNCGAMIGGTCKTCGGRISRKDRFCPGCGAKLE